MKLRTLTAALAALGFAIPAAAHAQEAAEPAVAEPVAAEPVAAEPVATDHNIPKDKSLMAEGEAEKAALHPADIENVTWKPGTGLTVSSKDGLFSVATRVRVQVRGEVANESGSPAEMGILLRRARLQFKGHSFGKHNKFKAEFAFSPADLRIREIDGNNLVRETPLLTWYMEFDQNPNATIRVGQYKIPFSRQRVISSGNQQMVDRSIANGEFNLDRDIGLDVRSKDLFDLGHFRYYAGVYNGEGRSAVGFGNSDLMYLARFEYLPFGIFKDYSESDFERLAKPGLSIGAAYSYAPNAVGTRVNRNGAPTDGGTTDVHSANADVTFKYQGFSASGEFHYRDGARNADETDPNFEEARNGIGWFAQAGYLLPRQPFEIAGRFGQLIAADDSSLGDANEAGLAVSYYPGQHPFKFQADVFQLWGDEDLADGETKARVQMQYSF
tara:strand:+ start:18675 stop:20000 length:1326 start_codon:yes stop_codon:yes gene_type:complete